MDENSFNYFILKRVVTCASRAYPGASSSCISIRPGFPCIEGGPLGGVGGFGNLSNLGMGAI